MSQSTYLTQPKPSMGATIKTACLPAAAVQKEEDNQMFQCPKPYQNMHGQRSIGQYQQPGRFNGGNMKVANRQYDAAHKIANYSFMAQVNISAVHLTNATTL
jgi:hypothetical protein